MNTVGTTFLLIVHAIVWCLSATKPELQTLTFTVHILRASLGFWCRV